MALLEVRELTKAFVTTRDFLGRASARHVAVDHVSLDVEEGETLAIVGESGAGKSTLGRLVVRLVPADSGTIRFDGEDLLALSQRPLRRARRGIQIIFQDPYSSLDPRLEIFGSVMEPLQVHSLYDHAERTRRTITLLERVGISRRWFKRLPGELSGGQLQRVAIARALTLRPKLIVCDEPVAALDVSVRAQVLELLRELQSDFGVAYLFISHDLAVVGELASRVAVMQAARIVETGSVDRIFDSPRHKYTKELIAAIPSLVPRTVRSDPVTPDVSLGVASVQSEEEIHGG